MEADASGKLVARPLLDDGTVSRAKQLQNRNRQEALTKKGLPDRQRQQFLEVSSAMTSAADRGSTAEDLGGIKKAEDANQAAQVLAELRETNPVIAAHLRLLRGSEFLVGAAKNRISMAGQEEQDQSGPRGRCALSGQRQPHSPGRGQGYAQRLPSKTEVEARPTH